jgi:NAD(P)-dependent dehydrogenase (short-subunit alcohol dehydrogenase family)
VGPRNTALQRVDHLVAAEVAALVARIRAEQGRLDILVNDIWGGERLFEWDKPVWGP